MERNITVCHRGVVCVHLNLIVKVIIKLSKERDNLWMKKGLINCIKPLTNSLVYQNQ